MLDISVLRNDKGIGSLKHRDRSTVTTSEEHFLRNEQPIRKAFRVIFKVSSLLGITYKCSVRQQNALCISFWDTIMGILAVTSYIISICTAHSVVQSPQMLYTCYAYITIGVLTRLILLAKRPNICLAVANMCSLYQNLQVKARAHYIGIKVQVVLFLIWLFTMAPLLGSYFYRSISGTSHLKYLIYDVGDTGQAYLVNIARTGQMIATISATAMISISLILCTNLYKAAKNMLKAYRLNLLMNSKNEIFTKAMLVSDISTYRKIVGNFRDLDDSVSCCAFLLYAAAVTCFFNTLSFAISDPNISTHLMDFIQTLITFLMSVVIFLSLTFTGSQVITEHNDLKIDVIEVAEWVSSSIFADAQVVTTFKMLTESVNNINPYFTGGEMFTINKSLMLTTAGAIITYGVLIFDDP